MLIYGRMRRILLGIFAALAVLSCTKEDRENTIVNQEESIDRYISSLSDVRIARNGGSNRIVYTEGTSEEVLAIGDSIKFYYAGYIFTGNKGQLFATNNPEVAQKSGFPVQESIRECILDNGDMLQGLAQGLVGARAGERCDVVFSAKYGFNNTVVYNVPKLSPLIFEVWVEEIVKN